MLRFFENRGIINNFIHLIFWLIWLPNTVDYPQADQIGKRTIFSHNRLPINFHYFYFRYVDQPATRTTDLKFDVNRSDMWISQSFKLCKIEWWKGQSSWWDCGSGLNVFVPSSKEMNICNCTVVPRRKKTIFSHRPLRSKNKTRLPKPPWEIVQFT